MLDRALETPATVATAASPWPQNPFPGLRPFHVSKDADESLIFYGRSPDKDQILQRLNSNHLVFVVGPSGCGKSSLIKAGVIPALEAGLLTQAGHVWRTAEMRPGERPLRHLAGAFARFHSDGADEPFVNEVYRVLLGDENGLWLVAETLFPRAGPTSPALLLIDQFEEVFGPQIASHEEVTRFLQCLIRFFEKPHPNLYCIVTMRTDFLGQCANLPKLADAINATLFVTPVLRRSELDKVIALPPEDYHGEVDVKLTKAIIEEMTSNAQYNPDHLPLMQHVLLWLWKKAIAETGAQEHPRPDQPSPAQPLRLTCKNYRKFDGLKGILNHHAEELFGRLDERSKQIAEVMFRRLSERDAENRYRRSPAPASAIRALACCSKPELESVVSMFADPDVAFIDRRPLADKDDELLDISHESLIRQWERLRKWADDEAEKVRSFRDLAKSAARWDSHDRSKDFFKARDELRYWENWRKQKNPTMAWIERYRLQQVEGKSVTELFGLTEEYLRRNHNSVARKRAAKIGTVVAGALLIWAGSAFLIDYENKKTVHQLAEAKARTLAARGEEALERDGATRALLIAVAGLKGATTYVPELERLAYRSLQDLREQRIFSIGSQFASSSFSPNGETLLLMDKRQMKFWDMKKDRLIAETSIPGFPGFIRPRWSDDGEWVIAGSGDGRTLLFAPCKQAALRPLFVSCQGKTDDMTRVIGNQEPSWPSTLSRDGNFLLSGGFGAPPKLWDLRRPNLEPVKLQDGPAGFAIAFHPHKNLTAIGAIDGSVRVHDSENPAVALHVLTIKKAQSVGATCLTGSSPPQLEVPVSSISFHPTDPDVLVATTNDGNVRVWNFVKEQAVCRLGIKSPGFTTATFNQAGNLIAITSEDGPLVWNLETHEVVTLRGHRRSTWMVDFRRMDENSLVSASSDSTRVWRMRAALQPMPLGQNDVDHVSGSVQVANEPLQVYNEARRKYIKFNVPPQALAAVSADGTHVLVARRNGDPKLASLMLYDSANSSEPIAIFQTPISEWKSVGFLTNPDRIVAVSPAGVASSWLYFRTPELLTKFALEYLPLQDSQTVELSAEDQCRLGIRPVSCQEVFALQGANRLGVF